MAGAHIGIAGAGLLGRLLAWRLVQAGHQVSVFDPAPDGAAPASGLIAAAAADDTPGGARPPHAAAFTAAGMLSPLAELENAGPHVAALGWRSLALWRDITAALSQAGGEPLLFRQLGSLMLAHRSDLGAAQRVLSRLAAPTDGHAGAAMATSAPGLAGSPAPAAAWPSPQPLSAAQLHALEPALASGLHGWLLPQEGQILPRQVMAALWAATPQAHWHWGTAVHSLAPHALQLAGGRSGGSTVGATGGPSGGTAAGETRRFDLVIDARGTGAGTALGPTQPVRGVRGELLWLHAPGLVLQRPLRLLHPRHRVYLVPRPGEVIVVGASEIESADRSPVSLRSAVELMAAAHSVLPELAEARILHLETNLRPALPDNQPHTAAQPGLLRINGLFRHGWLLAPALVHDALATLPALLGRASATTDPEQPAHA